MWIDSTYKELKRVKFGWRDLALVKTTDEAGLDTYHIVYGCIRQKSGSLADCESEWKKYVRCINKNNKKESEVKG